MLCADTENNMNNTETVKAGLKKRYAREKRFQFYGKAAVMSGFVFLIFLFTGFINVLSAFSFCIAVLFFTQKA